MISLEDFGRHTREDTQRHSEQKRKSGGYGQLKLPRAIFGSRDCCSGRRGRSGGGAQEVVLRKWCSGAQEVVLRKSSVSFPTVVQARYMLNVCIVVFCLIASMTARCIPSTEARTERLSFGRSSVEQCLAPKIGIAQP
jgi:hypothetical protein